MSGILAHAGLMLKMFDVAAIALIDSMTPTPSTSIQIAINNAVVSLRSAGYWTRFDRFGVIKGLADDYNRRIDWKDPTKFLTMSGGAVTTEADGFINDTIGGYGNTGFVPSTDGVNYTQNDASFFVYVKEKGAVVADTFIGASSNSATKVSQLIYSTGGASYTGMINDSTYTSSTPSADGPPNNSLLLLNRTGASAVKIYMDGVDISTSGETEASTGLPAVAFWLGCANVSGSVSFPTQAPIKAWGCGGSFTAAEQLAIKAIIDTYLAAI
jgi:hypothetical protein